MNHETIKRSSTKDVRNFYEGSHPNRTGKENSMNIIEQIYEEIVNGDWSKFAKVIKEEEKNDEQTR